MKTYGFTLVELSIVIVIIGLIVAGVMAGQSLVRQAKLRSVVTGFNEYKVAYNTFLLQYNAVPGDMNNAADYWAGVQEGDGDKTIECTTGTLEERYIFFRHLASAGLIPGSFDGDVTGCSSSDAVSIGPDAPAGPFSGSFYAPAYLSIYNNLPVKNRFQLLAIEDNASNYMDGALAAGEAQGIDAKIDDGRAAYGKVVSLKRRLSWPDEEAGTNHCTSGAYDGTPVEYNLADTVKNCVIMIDF